MCIYEEGDEYHSVAEETSCVLPLQLSDKTPSRGTVLYTCTCVITMICALDHVHVYAYKTMSAYTHKMHTTSEMHTIYKLTQFKNTYSTLCTQTHTKHAQTYYTAVYVCTYVCIELDDQAMQHPPHKHSQTYTNARKHTQMHANIYKCK